MLGTEAAVFVPNATTANVLALLAQLERGDAVLMDALSHINVVEWYGLALGGLVPRTIPSDRGHLDPATVETALADGAGGRAPRVGLVVLENTHTFAGGVAIDPDETAAVTDLAHRHGAVVHLDGARLFNAAVALGQPVSALTAGVDTIAVSLSKGLCAPYGGLLAGRAAVVQRARTLAFQIGFGRIYKSGYLAAAGIVALDTMIDRLADDHRRARRLGEGWAAIDGLDVDLEHRPDEPRPGPPGQAVRRPGGRRGGDRRARRRCHGDARSDDPGGRPPGDRRRRNRDGHPSRPGGPRLTAIRSRSPVRRAGRSAADPFPRQRRDVRLGRPDGVDADHPRGHRRVVLEVRGPS